MQPSSYQQAIIDWLKFGDGNALVRARAGSGKTSTLVMLSDLLDRIGTRAAFLAFNRAIAQELKKRLPEHVEAATFHSVCRSALLRLPQCRKYSARKDWVQKNKTLNILDTYSDDPQVERCSRGIAKLVGLMKANALLPECPESELLELITTHDIEFDERAPESSVAFGIKMARKVLEVSNADISVIDFDDMLYLTWLLQAPVQKYSHLFVDEAQDTNKIQRILMHRMVGTTGRLIAVGDEAQAIYGFRGADSDAMELIKAEFNCTEFPLSISYRCPRRVVALAQRIVPSIEARENAPEGTVSKLDAFKLDDFTKLDLVLCRNVAPLVSLAFKFLRAHKPVQVAGRDFGEQLIALVKKMGATSLEELAEKLDVYTQREVGKATKKKQDSKIERLYDQRDSLMVIIEGLPEDQLTVMDVVRVLDRIFDDKLVGCTTLSTIHKAKGQEATRVFILDGHLLPSKWARQEWQQKQETNLKYVAVTRSLDTLHFVESTGIVA